MLNPDAVVQTSIVGLCSAAIGTPAIEPRRLIRGVPYTFGERSIIADTSPTIGILLAFRYDLEKQSIPFRWTAFVVSAQQDVCFVPTKMPDLRSIDELHVCPATCIATRLGTVFQQDLADCWQQVDIISRLNQRPPLSNVPLSFLVIGLWLGKDVVEIDQ